MRKQLGQLRKQVLKVRTSVLIMFVFFCGLPGAWSSTSAPLEVKVVVVTMFEHGELSGDRPGEFQFWVERFPLEDELSFPLGQHPLRWQDAGVLGLCTGGGISNATASVMALGMDPRFDLSRAYWLIAGIAGGDPEDVTIGSGVWARYVIDGDLAFEIDAREIPKDWPYGLIPLGATKPARPDDAVIEGWTVDTVSFALSSKLAVHAARISQAVELPDFPASRAFTAQFDGFQGAKGQPAVVLGETLSASTYWHGRYLTQWANDWVKVHSSSDMNFMTSNMEDSGTLTALHRLAREGRVDPDRVMVLRTVSNFTQPPAGTSAAWSATADYPDDGLPALESAYRMGSAVAKTIVRDWSAYRDGLPDANRVTND